MLLKIQDVGEFLRKSFDSLEHMAKVSVTMKKEIYISTSLQPYIVNTAKTLDLINKFDLVPPSKDLFNNFELKFLKDAPSYAQQQENKPAFNVPVVDVDQSAEKIQEKKATGFYWAEPVEHLVMRGPGLLPDATEVPANAVIPIRPALVKKDLLNKFMSQSKSETNLNTPS